MTENLETMWRPIGHALRSLRYRLKGSRHTMSRLKIRDRIADMRCRLYVCVSHCIPIITSTNSRSLRLQLDSMPFLYLFSQHFVDQSMLLNNRQTLELIGDDIESVHRTAAARDILDLRMKMS